MNIQDDILSNTKDIDCWNEGRNLECSEETQRGLLGNIKHWVKHRPKKGSLTCIIIFHDFKSNNSNIGITYYLTISAIAVNLILSRSSMLYWSSSFSPSIIVSINK